MGRVEPESMLNDEGEGGGLRNCTSPSCESDDVSESPFETGVRGLEGSGGDSSSTPVIA